MSLVALTRPTPTADRLTDLDALLPGLTARFAATADAHDRDSSFPFENFAALHEAGLLALTAPVDLGGPGADLPTALKVIRAVARGEPATALVLVMQYLFLGSLDGRAGWPAHLKALVADEAIRNGGLINALRVEPELGTPARGGLPATVARRTPDGWRLSGRKIYSTGCPALTWFVVWARTDEPEPRVGGWLVHRDTPGWRIEETWDHTGLRASGSHDVIFEDAPVPLDRALSPQPPGGPPQIDPRFAVWSSVLTSAIYDSVARAARDWFVTWLTERKPANLGASLSTLPSRSWSAPSTPFSCRTAFCWTPRQRGGCRSPKRRWSSTSSPRTPSPRWRRPSPRPATPACRATTPFSATIATCSAAASTRRRPTSS